MLTTVVVATVGGIFGAAGGWLFSEAQHLGHHVRMLQSRTSVLEFTKQSEGQK